MSEHETLVGLHWHGEDAAGIEVACDCGAVLLEECSTDALLQLSELNVLHQQHGQIHEGK